MRKRFLLFFRFAFVVLLLFSLRRPFTFVATYDVSSANFLKTSTVAMVPGLALNPCVP